MLSLKRGGQKEWCLQCAERERERERTQEESEVRVMIAGAHDLAMVSGGLSANSGGLSANSFACMSASFSFVASTFLKWWSVSQLRVIDAKAAVLATRAECGRLRADLNHSLECLRAAGICFRGIQIIVGGLVPVGTLTICFALRGVEDSPRAGTC